MSSTWTSGRKSLGGSGKSAHFETLSKSLLAEAERHGESAGYMLPGAALSWPAWLAEEFPHVATAPMAPRHVRLWDWFERLERGQKPRPRVEPWPRGGGKSSTGELGCVRVGTKLSRRFVLYVGEGQAGADKHVQTIGGLFERMGVGRLVGAYGQSKGWTRSQLRTENGFNVAALGLDAAARGIRIEEFRPDLIIFDDIDGRHDTPAATKKKIELITDTILPTGSFDCAVLFLQNLIAKNSILSQLVDGRAPFLHNREVARVEVAVDGLSVERTPRPEDGMLEYRMTGGTPTWAGQNQETVTAQINEWGLSAFLRESQQEVEEDTGGLWDRERDLDPFYEAPPPQLERIVVSVDPSGSARGDEAGIVVCAVARRGKILHGWVLDDLSLHGSPHAWIAEAVRAYKSRRADKLLAEVNFGGELVDAAFTTEPGAPPVTMIRVSRGKLLRAEPVQALYEKGLIHHAKRLPNLERQQCTWKSGMPSPGALDAAVIGLSFLFGLHEMVHEVKSAPAVRPTVVGLSRR